MKLFEEHAARDYRELVFEFHRANYFHQRSRRSAAAALAGAATK